MTAAVYIVCLFKLYFLINFLSFLFGMLSFISFTLLANGATSIFVCFLFHLVVDNIQQLPTLPTPEKCHNNNTLYRKHTNR